MFSEEKRVPQDVIHGLMEADTLFEDIIEPQVNKLTYLKEVCENGVIGADPSWTEDYYRRLSLGLATIVQETIDALEDFQERLNEKADEFRQDPEFKKWVAEGKKIEKRRREIWDKHSKMQNEELERLEAREREEG